jgi:molybdenum cofactor biosynthesis enzyme MoaA
MQESKLADTWCRRISNASQFIICGPNQEWVSYQPCCNVFTPGCTIVSREDIHRVQNDIIDYVSKNKEVACRKCTQREANPLGKRSVRQLGNETISANSIWGQREFLSFILDTRCNAACVMCGPNLSTLWQKELNQPITVTQKTASNTVDKICSWIDWSPVRCVYFSGGEPLLTDTHKKILEHVPDISLLELRYATNGSIFPDESTINLWKQVRVLKLEISLDGTDEQYNYIRYPLKWKSVENNIHALATLLNSIPTKSEIHINCVVNPLNLMYLHNLDTWFKKMQTTYQFFLTLEYDQCLHHSWGLEGSTDAHKERFSTKHGPDHSAMLLFENLKLNPLMRQKLQNDLVILDNRRGLNWRETFADSTALFDD